MTTHSVDPPPHRDSLLALFGRRPRLLVVDDDADSRIAMAQMFAAEHDVLTAADADEAMRICADDPPDLVLLDVVMPGCDGYTACARLSAAPSTCDIPVIFVTGERDEAAETRALDVGGVDFITKPVNPRVVRARVRTHLLLKRQADLLRSWAYLDGLTAIANRRSFEERAASEWARSRRLGAPLSILMIDIDHFKAFNDHCGHLAGDECLRRIAATLASGLRRGGDLLARWGGEEFAALMPGTGPEEAAERARELLARIEALGIPHLSPPSPLPVVSVSAGVAAARPALEAQPASLVEAADVALYEAKRRGRRQVVTAGEQP